MNIVKTSLVFKADKLKRNNKSKVILIILHHACAQGLDVEKIHNMHLKNGWAGIGYHYYIRTDGTVYEGRPNYYVGSHCSGNNSCSIGVCFEGDFRKTKPTKEQIESCKELCKVIKKQFPKVYKILNHKDLYPTLCPVVDLKEMVGQDCLNF